MTLLGATLPLDPPLANGHPRHRIDDAENFCGAVVSSHIRLAGAYFPAGQGNEDDLMAFLIATLWEFSQRFDPAKANGKPFSHHAVSLLHRRIPSWYRQRFGSTRYRQLPALVAYDDANETVGEDDAPPTAITADVAALLTPQARYAHAELLKAYETYGPAPDFLDAYCQAERVPKPYRRWLEHGLVLLRRELAAQEIRPSTRTEEPEPAASARVERRRKVAA